MHSHAHSAVLPHCCWNYLPPCLWGWYLGTHFAPMLLESRKKKKKKMWAAEMSSQTKEGNRCQAWRHRFESRGLHGGERKPTWASCPPASPCLATPHKVTNLTIFIVLLKPSCYICYYLNLTVVLGAFIPSMRVEGERGARRAGV